MRSSEPGKTHKVADVQVCRSALCSVCAHMFVDGATAVIDGKMSNSHFKTEFILAHPTCIDMSQPRGRHVMAKESMIGLGCNVRDLPVSQCKTLPVQVGGRLTLTSQDSVCTRCALPIAANEKVLREVTCIQKDKPGQVTTLASRTTEGIAHAECAKKCAGVKCEYAVAAGDAVCNHHARMCATCMQPITVPGEAWFPRVPNSVTLINKPLKHIHCVEENERPARAPLLLCDHPQCAREHMFGLELVWPAAVVRTRVVGPDIVHPQETRLICVHVKCFSCSTTYGTVSDSYGAFPRGAFIVDGHFSCTDCLHEAPLPLCLGCACKSDPRQASRSRDGFVCLRHIGPGWHTPSTPELDSVTIGPCIVCTGWVNLFGERNGKQTQVYDDDTRTPGIGMIHDACRKEPAQQ